jgi:L-amino acid N-acyltransferase YncA
MIRRARRADLAAVVALVAEHAAFERAAAATEGLEERLAAAAFQAGRLFIWVAERDGVLVGYASASREFATWQGAEHLHLDCLFLGEGARGLGLGAAFMQAVTAHARQEGLDRVEWQTPAWNEAAIAFYRRGGARDLAKARFSLEVACD